MAPNQGLLPQSSVKATMRDFPLASDVTAKTRLPSPTRAESHEASLLARLFPKRVPKWLLLAVILFGALVLRLWGIRHDLPYVFSSDERAHFVPYAMRFFRHGYNPEYFINPPGFTYLLHGVFSVRYGGASGALEAFSTNRGDVFLTARIVSAVLGVLAVWLLYMTAHRLFDRRVALVSAALMAVAFLPTLYSHRAVNDVPTLVPVTLSLLGSAGILLRGKRTDYLIAGAGAGLACAFKYLGGVVLAPFALAAATRIGRGKRTGTMLLWLGLGSLAAVAAFFVANPFAFFDHQSFLRDMEFVSPRRFVEAEPKLGTRIDHGVVFYLWTITWGLGWVPAIAAAVGAVLLALKDRLRFMLLVPGPLAYLLFMGARRGYFARYLLPIYPFLVILSAYSAMEASDAFRRRFAESRFRRPLHIGIITALVTLLLGQSLAHSIHTDRVLTRPNTRVLVQDWMVRHIPSGARVFIEPMNLALGDKDSDNPTKPSRTSQKRWRTFSYGQIQFLGGFVSRNGIRERRFRSPKLFTVGLRPEIVDVYFRHRICWVIISNGQWGRAFNDPEKVPRAIEYYEELAERARVQLHIRPYRSAQSLPYDLDLWNTLYRFELTNPGPEIIVYQIPAPGCRSRS